MRLHELCFVNMIDNNLIKLRCFQNMRGKNSFSNTGPKPGPKPGPEVRVQVRVRNLDQFGAKSGLFGRDLHFNIEYGSQTNESRRFV